MQIIQPLLGNNVHPLGVISFLSHPDRILLKKESHSLSLRNNFISTIQTKPPLVTSSKFLLSREHEPSIEPLIGWDTQDINSEFPLLEFDSFDSIAPPDKSNINSSKSVKSSIPEILPNRIDNNTSNDTSQEISIKGKSRSKKTNKSQQPAEKKSKLKSKTTKTVKSSAAKNVAQFVDENNITINRNEDKLFLSDEALSIEANSELPTLQLDLASENITNDKDYLSILMPSIKALASPIVEDKSTLFRKIDNDNLEVNSEIKPSFISTDSSVLSSQENTELDNNTSELAEDSLREFPLSNNVEEIFTQYSNFAKNEQQIITEASESFNISDISINKTPSKQNIKTYQLHSLVDNPSTASQTNLIQAEEISPTLNSPSQEEELPNTKAIERNLILESTANDFVTDNAVVDNSLTLSPTLTSPDVDDTLYPVANDENTIGTHVTATNSESSISLSPTLTSPDVDDTLYPVANDENTIGTHVTTPNPESSISLSPTLTSPDFDDTLYPVANDENTIGTHVTTPNPESSISLSPTLISPDVDDTLYPVANDENTIRTHVAASNSEPSVAKNPITVQQEIDSGVTSESPAIAAVQLTSTLANIKDKPSLFRNSDNNEQLVTSESQSAMAVSVSDISENLTSLQGDSNVENTTSESKESYPILGLPEIGEAPLTATSPEIAETLSIFRKIIDNEQTAESELLFAVTNPEISTFVDNSDNPISPQDDTSTPTEVEQNTIAENLPAHKGYATGGHVTDSRVENRQQIAHSDSVPAMLTPGEFVINTRDAQKNLSLLHHINTGGTPHDIILPSLQPPNPTEPKEKTSSETPTKVDSFSDTSLQLKSAETHSPQISNSLIPSSLGLNIGKHQLSILNSPQLHTLQNETTDVGEPSPQYSSPPLIFRKANPTSNTSSQWSNTPSEWSSVEELLNGNNDQFTGFNFDNVESNSQNSEFSPVSESPQISAKHVLSFRGFADGGEVTPPDISREIQPVTETIESASASVEEGNKDDTADLEALAREIYNRLRQRVEIERERHGGFSGRLPW